MCAQYLRVASARISNRCERFGSMRFSGRLAFQPVISERCRASVSWQRAKKDSSTSQTMEALDPRSLPDSDVVRVRLGAGLGACGIDEHALVSEEAAVNGRLARMVPPLVSQSSSSSAISANTSGSSSSTVDIQHMREGSKIMFPTLRAPEEKWPATGEPIDEPVRCVIRAGRVDVPTSKSRRA